MASGLAARLPLGGTRALQQEGGHDGRRRGTWISIKQIKQCQAMGKDLSHDKLNQNHRENN